MNPLRNCEGMTRRNCLQLGLAGFAGGGLTNLLRLRAQAAESSPTPAKRAARKPTSDHIFRDDFYNNGNRSQVKMRGPV